MKNQNTEGNYTGYKIEDRGAGLCAVFQLKSPTTNFEHRYNHANVAVTVLVEKREAAFNEASLASRVENLKKGGYDSALSERALADLRACNAGLAPK